MNLSEMAYIFVLIMATLGIIHFIYEIYSQYKDNKSLSRVIAYLEECETKDGIK